MSVWEDKSHWRFKVCLIEHLPSFFRRLEGEAANAEGKRAEGTLLHLVPLVNGKLDLQVLVLYVAQKTADSLSSPMGEFQFRMIEGKEWASDGCVPWFP